MELDRARATLQSELPAALSRQASGSSAKASSSPPPNTTPPYTTTHSPLLSSSTHLSPPHHNPPPPPPPPSIISSSPPLAPRRVTPAFNTHLLITRRRTRSLHIIHHGSVIENACCCPRNGWRRRCSSAGKSYSMILFRNTVVLALSLHAHLQSTIRIPKELSISILGVWFGTSCLAINCPVDCGCLKPALLLLVSKHGVIATEATQARLRYLHQHSRRIENNIRYKSQSQACRNDKGSHLHPRSRWSAPAKRQRPPAMTRTPRLILPHLMELQSLRTIIPDVMSAILHRPRAPVASLLSVLGPRDLGRQTAGVK